jgi:DNA-directed RNA polymerase subunit H (RpoH/RPB5)
VFNITIEEIKDVLLNLKLGKAVGNDKISHNMLKHTASTVISENEQKNVFRRLALSSSFTANSPVASFCKDGRGDEVD